MDEKAIAIRSKECIVEAFFELMENDQFSRISISEIAAKAELDRRTFYRHFKTKDDIITYYLKTSAKEYEVALSKNTVFDNKAIAEAFFTVCNNQKIELTLLLKQNLSHLLLAEISEIFAAYQKRFAAEEELEHPHKDYMLAYHIGGFWNIMNQWLSNGYHESPEEMAGIIGQIMEVNQI